LFFHGDGSGDNQVQRFGEALPQRVSVGRCTMLENGDVVGIQDHHGEHRFASSRAR
jgi:hypothetical protein